MQLLKPSWVSFDGLALMSIDIHPDGQRFVVGGQGVDCGRVSIWNMKPLVDENAAKDQTVPKLLTQMDHHEGCVNCVRWSNDGKYLASGGDDKLVMIWEKSAYGGGSIFGSAGKVHVESWRLKFTLRGHNGDVLHVAWNSFDNLLASASVDNTIMVWNAEKFPELVTTLKGHTGLVKGLVFDPVGKYLASQSDDKTLRIWKTSDWSQDTIIEKPFHESGGTTSVLRPDWSPDGSLLVSAHSMNGGGPTAQIIERSGWRFQRDFVGHRKAVSCVRFNRAIFERKKLPDGKKGTFVTLALGSRDRSISVWSTDLQRPYFVVYDLFEQAVVDLSWSKDGRVLLACSMDGSVAAAVLNPQELGIPISDEQVQSIMMEEYGKSYAKPISLSTSKQNGTVVIENPDMLKASSKFTNGMNSSKEVESKTKVVLKGPIDKQIEARTSDGRRRITPVFIPPPSIANGIEQISTPFGSSEFGSSSSQSKSQITVEKRDVIVTPNISPGKHSNDSNSLMAPNCANETSQSSSTPVKTATESTKVVESKQSAEPTKPPNISEPVVNIIQVKRKPRPAESPSKQTGTSDTTDKVSSEPPSKDISNPKSNQSNKEFSKKAKESDSESLTIKKKRSSRVIVDSSGEEESESRGKEAESSSSSTSGSSSSSSSGSSSSSSSSSGSSSSSEDETDDKLKNKQVSEKKSAPGSTSADKTTEKLKESRMKKPDLMLKRKAQEPEEEKVQPRKRIRPLLQREVSADTSATVTNGLPEYSKAEHQTLRRLPGLRAEKSKIYSFSVNSYKASIIATNYISAFGSNCNLHQLKCTISGKLTWESLFSSPICAMSNGKQFAVVACQDGSLHFFSVLKGLKMFPPMVLDSEIARLAVNNFKVAVITTEARLYAWDLDSQKALMKGESIASLLAPSDLNPNNAVNISKLMFSENGQLVVVTSACKSFIFNEMLSAWLKISDASSAVQSISDYATASANLPAETRGLPLSSLSCLTPIAVPRVQSVSEDLRSAASISHCQDQILCSKYLGSPHEYKFWLMAEVKQLAKQVDVAKLRSIFEDLLGPITSGGSCQWESHVIGLSKNDLLREALRVISGNLDLQRLYSEFNEQLKAGSDLNEVDKMLEIFK